MLILTAGNVTGDGKLQKNGLSDYNVWVGINQHMIFAGKITGHVRDAGAAALLRKIADAIDTQPCSESKESPVHEAIRRVMKEPACPKCHSKKLRCSENGCTWEVT